MENVRFELFISSILVFYKKMATSKIRFDEICVKSLVQPGQTKVALKCRDMLD